jgi:hypothetical protein
MAQRALRAHNTRGRYVATPYQYRAQAPRRDPVTLIAYITAL